METKYFMKQDHEIASAEGFKLNLDESCEPFYIIAAGKIYYEYVK